MNADVTESTGQVHGAALLHTGATVGALALRALRRFGERTAFVWDGKSLTYRGTEERIGRLQAVFAGYGLRRGARIAFLTGNIADIWCASTAAEASAMSITWLHSLASFDDQVFQLDDAEVDALVVDAYHYAERGAAIAAHLPELSIFRFGPGDFGIDLDAESDKVGTQPAHDLAVSDDIAILNYTDLDFSPG